MNRKINFFWIALITISCSSCGYRIVRTGYDIKKSDHKYCDIIIKKNAVMLDSLVEKVGEVKLGETGFTSSCSEANAILILKGEGCAIGAELINITEENRPDLWSSCYRCKATFYKFKTPREEIDIHNDTTYDSEKVAERVGKDRKKNVGVYVGSFLIGVVLGLAIFI